MDRAAFLVGIGASAGGLKALVPLVEAFDHDGSAFVIVTHLPDDFESRLADVLRGHSRLQLCPLEHGVVLAPNRVYVLGAGRELRLGDRDKAWITRRATGTRHLIDVFFHSLADERGASAIGVVLSGAGRDGAQGLAAIRAAGGRTFAQEPYTAQFRSMPEAAADHADEVLPPYALGEALMRFVLASESQPRT
jgi:two-component system CheB/CheR fusion protein